MDNDNLENINYYFHELIESREYLDQEINNNQGEEIIKNCFLKIKSDSNKIITFSLY